MILKFCTKQIDLVSHFSWSQS